MKKDKILIETNKKGVLTVYNNIAKEDSIYISAPKAQFLKVNLSKLSIAQALNIPDEYISDKYNIDFIDAGLKTLIVPIQELKNEISIYLDEASLKDFCLNMR